MQNNNNYLATNCKLNTHKDVKCNAVFSSSNLPVSIIVNMLSETQYRLRSCNRKLAQGMVDMIITDMDGRVPFVVMNPLWTKCIFILESSVLKIVL